MRTTLLLLFIALGCAFGLQFAPAWAFTTDSQEDICAQSWVILCENFETYKTGVIQQNYAPPLSDGFLPAHFKNGGWAFADCYWTAAQCAGKSPTYTNGSLQIVSSPVFDGTRAFQFEYNVNDGASGIEGYYANIPDLYIRWYVMWESNWVNGFGNKELYVGNQSYPHNVLCGDETSTFNCVTQQGNPIANHRQNVDARMPTFNAWHCREMHWKMNSAPGRSDGLYEGWLDKTLISSYPNINVSTVDTTFTAVHPDGYWNCYVGQDPTRCADRNGDHPLMHRWYDNIVIATQRIGCLGTLTRTSDTTPPTAPIGLTIR